MARGRKANTDYEAEFERIDARIIRHKNTIAELQEERKALLEKKRKAEMDALYAAMEKSGKSLDEVLSELSGQEQESEQESA